MRPPAQAQNTPGFAWLIQKSRLGHAQGCHTIGDRPPSSLQLVERLVQPLHHALLDLMFALSLQESRISSKLAVPICTIENRSKEMMDDVPVEARCKDQYSLKTRELGG